MYKETEIKIEYKQRKTDRERAREKEIYFKFEKAGLKKNPEM